MYPVVFVIVIGWLDMYYSLYSTTIGYFLTPHVNNLGIVLKLNSWGFGPVLGIIIKGWPSPEAPGAKPG